MKLKDFFFSTLPRSRKSKRKQSKAGVPSNPSEAASSPETDDVIIRNHNLRSDVVNANGKTKHRIPGVAESAPAQHVSYNQQLVSADFRYLSDNNCNNYSTNPFGYQTVYKAPSNASESGFEDSYDHQLGHHDVITRQPDILSDSFATFPRERTRIKTNPWVTTHSNSMTSSIHGQVGGDVTHGLRAASPYYVSPSSLYASSRGSSSSNYSSYHDNSYHDNSYHDNSYHDNSYHENSYHENSYYPDSSSASSLAPDSSVPDSPLADHVTNNDMSRDRCACSDGKQDGVLEGGDLVINLNTGDIFVKSAPVFAPIDFRYEEDLDATLERDIGRQKVKSRRKRDERKCYYLTQDDLSANGEEPSRDLKDSATNYVVSYADDSDSEDGDNDGTLTRDQGTSQSCHLAANRHAARKRLSRPRKYRMDAILSQEATNEQPVYSPYVTQQRDTCRPPSEQPKEAIDSAYDSSTLSSVTCADDSRYWPITLPGATHRNRKPSKSGHPDRRSLEEIRNSLRVKVDRLKAEKRIVDEKVKQAREEDDLRREEKARIEQEVTSLRRHVLLRTLEELKANLEDQSRRLQEAYDDVIDMQWMNAKLRRLRNTTL